MTRIPLVEPGDAPENIQEIYNQFQGEGSVLNVMKLFGNHAGFLSGLAQLLNSLYTENRISPRYRELAWLRTSQLNHCHY
jgi:alkylhydroperoxidase family enzyme